MPTIRAVASSRVSTASERAPRPRSRARARARARASPLASHDRELAAYDALLISSVDIDRDVARAFETDARGARDGRRPARARATYAATRTHFGCSLTLRCDVTVAYAYATSPVAIRRAFAMVHAIDVAPDGSRARCAWTVAYGDAERSERARFSTHANVVRVREVVSGTHCEFDAMSGFPLGASVRARKLNDETCVVDAEAYAHAPIELARDVGTIAFGIDAQAKFAIAMEEFKTMVERENALEALRGMEAEAEANAPLGARGDFYFTKRAQ